MDKRRLGFMNRQPTLWSHGLPGVEFLPSDDDSDVIKVSPLAIEPLNMDHDGDTSALYCVHDNLALDELEKNAFLKNVVYYDAYDTFLSTIRHEALYAAYILTQYEPVIYNKKKDKIDFKINSLIDLKEDLILLNTGLNKLVEFNNEIITYGCAIFNKWMGCSSTILIKEAITKKYIQTVSKLIYEEISNFDTAEFYDKITDLEKKLFFFITVTNHNPSLNLEEMMNVVDEETKDLFLKLPSSNAYIGYSINEALLDRCINKMNKNNELYKLYKSGSRFSKVQLARTSMNIGYLADDLNVVDQKPITSSLLEGLTEEEFHQGSYGTRKGLIDKQKSTPDSGYLERTIVMALSIMEIVEDDCGTNLGIEVIVQSKDHVKTLIGKYYKLNKEDPWLLLEDEKIGNALINNKIFLRSTMLCKTPNFKICKKCFGEKKIRTKYAGIVAGQSITERLTQLSMRTFHTSGSATLDIDKNIILFLEKYLVNIINKEEDKSIRIITSCNDLNEIPNEFRKLKGFDDIVVNSKNFIEILFKENKKTIYNADAADIINKVNAMLKKEEKVISTAESYYSDLISIILSVGVLYSSYIEMLLTHMFLTEYDKDNNVFEFWRYNSDKKIVFKLGDKALSRHMSPLLGLLYQANKSTIDEVDLDTIRGIFDKDLDDINNLTIHEKIFLGII